MNLTGWKYFSVSMALVLALATGMSALMSGPVIAAAPPLQPWAQLYAADSGDSVANDIAVDSSGNVYVTGVSENITGLRSGLGDTGSGTVNRTQSHTDYATIKYSPSGIVQWIQRYSIDGDSVAKAIAVDASGNVYITGASENVTFNSLLHPTKDFATIKYSPTGAQLWVARYSASYKKGNTSIPLDSEANAISVDSSGNVYVTGVSENGTFSALPLLVHPEDYATIKYSPTGAQLWVARYSASYKKGNSTIPLDSEANAIALDSSGNAYVTGVSDNITDKDNSDYATIKYDASSGAPLWLARYWDVGDNEAKAIVVDSSGNAYVTGYSSNGINDDYATLKYNSSGAQQWLTRYSVDGDSVANDIALDCSGNAYVTGYSDNSTDNFSGQEAGHSRTHTDYATVMYNTSTGVQQWAMRYTAGGDSEANAIAVDCCGNAYVTGYSKSSGNGDYDKDYATVKYVQQPAITTVNPSNGLQGQCPMTVIITGTNFNLATAVSFGAGITVSSFTVNSCTQITATICIDAGAAAGPRDISVIITGTTATLTGGFTVNAPSNPLIGTGSHGSSVGGATGTVSTTYGFTPPISLPNLQVQSASLSTRTVAPGAPITVTADIANKSAVNGNKKVTLYVNGQVETTQGVTVNSGGSSKLTFNVSRNEPGSYNVQVDGIPAGSFVVDQFADSNIIAYISGALILLTLIVGIFYLAARKRTPS